MSNNELQEILRARFASHTHPTDEAVWNAIEAQLDAQQKDRPRIWFWLLNGLAMILLFSAMQWSGTSTSNQLSNSDQKNGKLASEFLEKNSQISKNTSDNVTPIAQEMTSETLLVQAEKSLGGNKNLGSNKLELSSRTGSKDQRILEVSTKLIHLDSNPPEIGRYVPPIPEFLVVTGESPDEDLTNKNDLVVDHLLLQTLDEPKPLETKNELSLPSPHNRRNYLKNLPIHLGAEFSYLKRDENNSGIPNTADTTITTINNQLTINRHFEVSAFSQFDFTRRFSASIGVGYSWTSAYFPSDTTYTFATTIIPAKTSKMRLITLPVQAKFNFVQKTRFGLHGGLTFQTEFGKISYAVTQIDPISTVSTPTETQSQEPLESQLTIRQFSFEPFAQFSFSLTPRITSFANLGYKMYLNQKNQNAAPFDRLNYYNADFGVLFRLK